MRSAWPSTAAINKRGAPPEDGPRESSGFDARNDRRVGHARVRHRMPTDGCRRTLPSERWPRLGPRATAPGCGRRAPAPAGRPRLSRGRWPAVANCIHQGLKRMDPQGRAGGLGCGVLTRDQPSTHRRLQHCPGRIPLKVPQVSHSKGADPAAHGKTPPTQGPSDGRR